MLWNWQLAGWPDFQFNSDCIAQQEKKFLLAAGSSSAFFKKIHNQDQQQFILEILSSEGEESSRIEGEILDRESLRSSIKKHFGISITPVKRQYHKEVGMAQLLCDVYETYEKPLSHEMLWEWHQNLFQNIDNLEVGKYRAHEDPMQIVSHRLDTPKVYFEAPPSENVYAEMDRFINWFNSSEGKLSILGRAAIAHLYFENIHPFEDGNGRIGRALVEKSLSQGVGRSILIAVSKVLENRKKEYYQALEACNRTLDATSWVKFFADVVLEAQEESLKLLNFIIEKSKLMSKLVDKLNLRQEKVLLRMFEEGPEGFKGGLNAEKYIAITKTSRATATRDLAELVALEALLKTGELRHTRYWLNIVS
jgi:Fic family protein